MASKRSRSILPRSRYGCSLILSLLAGAAQGDPERLWLAGAETAASNQYQYAGLLLPAAGGHLGEGLRQRYWADRLTYRYESGGRTIRAEAYGAEAALGYAATTRHGVVAGYLGVLYRDTDLRPEDPGNAARGGQFRLKAQLENTIRLAYGREVDLMASYIVGQRGYWGRARLRQPLDNGLHTGPEFLLQGDPEYRVSQAGWFLGGLSLGTGVELGLKAGVRMQRGEGNHGYLGVEFTGLF